MTSFALPHTCNAFSCLAQVAGRSMDCQYAGLSLVFVHESITQAFFFSHAQSYSAAAKVSAEENIEAFRKALISNGDEAENAREKLKSATLPGTRNRVKSAATSRTNSGIQTLDEFPDDTTDEVINTLAKSATVPDSRTRQGRKRPRASNRKSGK